MTADGVLIGFRYVSAPDAIVTAADRREPDAPGGQVCGPPEG